MTVEPGRLRGMALTDSVPTRTSVPALVKLDNVMAYPARVSWAPELMVKVEIVMD